MMEVGSKGDQWMCDHTKVLSCKTYGTNENNNYYDRSKNINN